MKISLSNLSKNNLNNLALTHMVPAGCQIANPRLFTDEPARAITTTRMSAMTASIRISTLNGGAKKRFHGACSTPPTAADSTCRASAVESMYDAAFHANSTGKWVEIVR